MDDGVTEFGIGPLAERTGLTPEALRAWERRYALQIGTRSASGHRRFTDEDVRLVRRVVEGRERGLALAVAVAQATARRRGGFRPSVHATLAEQHPGLHRTRLAHRPLVSLSYAIEDELMARGERTVVWGGFQDARAYRRSRPRWEELARTSTWCVVLADLSDGGAVPEQGRGPGRPVLVDLPWDSPMRREWCVAALTPTFAVILSAWEVPSVDGVRTYETVISTLRPVVLSAGRAMTEMARLDGVTPPAEVEDVLAGADVGAETTSAEADRLWARVVEALAVGSAQQGTRS